MPQKETESQINHKQEAFLLSLLSLPTLQAACLAAKISDETARRWLKLPEVQSRYQELKRQYVDDSLSELVRHTSGAVAVISAIMNDTEEAGAVRLRAAALILEQVVQLQKVSALERDVEELKALVKERNL
jgi:hypothetical protein